VRIYVPLPTSFRSFFSKSHYVPLSLLSLAREPLRVAFSPRFSQFLVVFFRIYRLYRHPHLKCQFFPPPPVKSGTFGIFSPFHFPSHVPTPLSFVRRFSSALNFFPSSPISPPPLLALRRVPLDFMIVNCIIFPFVRFSLPFFPRLVFFLAVCFYLLSFFLSMSFVSFLPFVVFSLMLLFELVSFPPLAGLVFSFSFVIPLPLHVPALPFLGFCAHFSMRTNHHLVPTAAFLLWCFLFELVFTLFLS